MSADLTVLAVKLPPLLRAPCPLPVLVVIENKRKKTLDLRNLEVIRPSGAAAPKDVKPFKDRQLDKAMEYLKEQIKAEGKAPAKKNG